MRFIKYAAALVATGTVGSSAFAAPPSSRQSVDEISPCAEGMRDDRGESGGNIYHLCSTNPDRGNMDKELWLSTDGGKTFVDRGPAPKKGIPTGGFVVPSANSAAIGASAADQCVVYVTFDAGGSWLEALTVTDGAPASNLSFTDANNGSVVCGFDETARTYRTHDGGRTWAFEAWTAN